MIYVTPNAQATPDAVVAGLLAHASRRRVSLAAPCPAPLVSPAVLRRIMQNPVPRSPYGKDGKK